ncbi:MAG: hypothetical protein ABMA13_22490 [Chthoniobacteraceae bacterium]
MNTTTLRFLLPIALCALLGVPADAARSTLFGRSSRSMMGVGDSGSGEMFGVTPGPRGLRTSLRRIGSIGYSRNGGSRMTMNFGRNSLPRSIRSANGGMSFTGLRGGGMRALVRNLRGRRVGSPMTIFPGAGALAERGGNPARTSFRFTGFDNFGFSREQLLNDVPLFGDAIARLVESGFSSVNLFFQRLSAEFLLQPGVFDGLVPDTITDASSRTISDFTDTNAAQNILTAPFDIVAFLRPQLVGRDLNDDGVVNFRDARLLAKLERTFASNADAILAALNDFALLQPLLDQVETRATAGAAADFTPFDPASIGTIEFADEALALLENSGATFVYVTRNGGTLGEATAEVVRDPSSTAEASRARFTAATVTWKDGEGGPKAMPIKIIDNRVVDGDTDLILSIPQVTGANSGSQSLATVTIVDNDSTSPGHGIAVARDTVLVLEYSWTRDKNDLDTGTTFLNETVGFAHADFSQYMAWSGDDRNRGGKEIVVIDINSAVANGEPIGSSFGIDAAADWYLNPDTNEASSGDALLTAYFRDTKTGRNSPRASVTILPDQSSTGAFTPVADVDMMFDSFIGLFSFELVPAP